MLVPPSAGTKITDSFFKVVPLSSICSTVKQFTSLLELADCSSFQLTSFFRVERWVALVKVNRSLPRSSLEIVKTSQYTVQSFNL